MADLEEPTSLASTFPNPPPFWRDFTTDRLAKFESFQEAHPDAKDDDKSRARLSGIPEDLVNLQPPAEPANGRWRVFGDQYMLDDQLPTLEEQGITNLPATYPLPSNATTTANTPSGHNPPTAPATSSTSITPYDRAHELKRLIKSLLLNFLELVGTLSHAPSSADSKIADIRTLFINIHHVLNEYRPHQARESAIELMMSHLDKVRGETVAVRGVVEKARRVVEGLGSLRVDDDNDAVTRELLKEGRELVNGSTEGAGAGKVKEDGSFPSQRDAEIWAATDAICGLAN